MKKTLIAVVSTVLICCCVFGGTLAWLTAKSATVTNTFTFGDIKITLAETTGDEYKVIPGASIDKDPTVTVKADSEACWLFVKITESQPDAVTNDVFSYTLDGWTEVTTGSGVYYREVGKTNADTPFAVFKDNKVTIGSALTQADITAMNTTNPTIVITAYAVQKEAATTATAAWDIAKAL